MVFRQGENPPKTTEEVCSPRPVLFRHPVTKSDMQPEIYFSFIISFVLRFEQITWSADQLEFRENSDWSTPRSVTGKTLSVLRSNLESYPSSSGDHHHPAILTSKKSSKNHLGHFIYRIKRLAYGQIAYNGKGVHKTPCITIFLFLYKEILEKNTP